MDYRLENIESGAFEKLVSQLCEKKLGTGIVRFTDGPDGGRDGRFEGVANMFPSKARPWEGRFIIQSKHTTDYKASCSDNTFFSNQTSTVNKEIERLKRLKEKGEVIDCYIIFTNRKETGLREDMIKYIKKKVSITNVEVIGKNTLNEWLLNDPATRKIFDLDIYKMPFEFYENEIKEVIEIFHETLPKSFRGITGKTDRPDINVKNSINNLDSNYYKNIILSDLNRYHDRILEFLYDPKNEDYANSYENTAMELKRVIESNIEMFSDFKNVFEYLVRYMIEKEPVRLQKYRNTIPAIFHFMYYRCDIGRAK